MERLNPLPPVSRSMRVEELVRKVVKDECDYLGFADLTSAKKAVEWQCGLDTDVYPRAVSIGIALMDDIVDLVPRREERWAAIMYKSHSYEVINSRLDHLSSKIASELQRAGFRALPIPASLRVSDERLCGPFSHKMAAHLAGLGWIGKSCLLVTPEHGPRVRWTSVLTDAPMRELGTPMEQRCGDCMECVKACPESAFTGRNFIEREPREARFDAVKCERHYKELTEQGKTEVCGMCLYVCPHGKSGRSLNRG